MRDQATWDGWTGVECLIKDGSDLYLFIAGAGGYLPRRRLFVIDIIDAAARVDLELPPEWATPESLAMDLRAASDERGIDSGVLAQALGISVSYAWRLLNAKRFPSLLVACLWACFLGRPLRLRRPRALAAGDSGLRALMDPDVAADARSVPDPAGASAPPASEASRSESDVATPTAKSAVDASASPDARSARDSRATPTSPDLEVAAVDASVEPPVDTSVESPVGASVESPADAAPRSCEPAPAHTDDGTPRAREFDSEVAADPDRGPAEDHESAPCSSADCLHFANPDQDSAKHPRTIANPDRSSASTPEAIANPDQSSALPLGGFANPDRGSASAPGAFAKPCPGCEAPSGPFAKPFRRSPWPSRYWVLLIRRRSSMPAPRSSQKNCCPASTMGSSKLPCGSMAVEFRVGDRVVGGVSPAVNDPASIKQEIYRLLRCEAFPGAIPYIDGQPYDITHYHLERLIAEEKKVREDAIGALEGRLTTFINDKFEAVIQYVRETHDAMGKENRQIRGELQAAIERFVDTPALVSAAVRDVLRAATGQNAAKDESKKEKNDGN